MSKLEIYTIENPPTSDTTDHIERKLSDIENEKSKKLDKNEALKEARGFLLGNELLYKRFLKAILDKDNNRDVRGLSSIENLFIAYLQYLPEDEIDSVVRQFNTEFKYFIMKHGESLDINPEQKRRIFENDEKVNKEIHGNISAEGIKNVIRFIQARRKLLGINPPQEYGFYVEDFLDARYKIDLIECIYNTAEKNVPIDVMNLIQIKSKTPNREDQDEIIEDHKSWITFSVMDMEMFEHEYAYGIPEGLTIENLAKNADEVKDLLLDMCTDPKGFNAEEFISKLDLGKLTNKQKAWLLMKYGSILKNKINEAVTHGILGKIEAEAIIEALERLESRIKAKARMPKKLSHINEINSIIAVGSQIVREERLLSRERDTLHKKIVRTHDIDNV